MTKRNSKLGLMGVIIGAGLFGASANAEVSIDTICARDGIECLKSEAGIVIGTPGSTAAYTGGMDRAAARFEEYFGVPAPQAAVVLGEIVDAGIRSELRSLYPVVLPWLTIKDRETMVAAGVRAQVRRQRPDIDDAALEAIVKRSVEASMSASGGVSEGLHQGVFAHELGHLYFIRSFWPEDNLDVTQVTPGEVTRYAGPAPDWLDEMAAVLMENDALTNRREEGLKSAKAADDDYHALWSLDEYFTMQHPAFEQARRLIAQRQATAEGRARGGVVMLSGDQLDRRDDGRSPATFYAQSRGFADFLIDQTGDKQIFADIARHIAAGGDMDSWLTAQGAALGLPLSTHDLERQFKAWLDTRYDGKLPGAPAGHGHL